MSNTSNNPHPAHEGVTVYQIELPPSGGFPRLQHTPTDLTMPSLPVWRQPFRPEFLQPSTEEEHHAWRHFCHGHHHEFLYWQTIEFACDRVTQALADTDSDQAVFWLRRAATLVRGSAAVLTNCGAFDPAVYDPFLRVSMQRVRDDFSGDSSADFLAMMLAKVRLLDVLKQETNQGETRAEAERNFHDAEKYWFRKHVEVIVKLHPGDSLLQEKLKHLTDAGVPMDYQHYVEKIIHGQEAKEDYDRFFGVVRNPNMSLEAYWTMAVWKLALVHDGLHLPAETLRWLMCGDSVLMSVLSERLQHSLEAVAE